MNKKEKIASLLFDVFCCAKFMAGEGDIEKRYIELKEMGTIIEEIKEVLNGSDLDVYEE